MYRLTSPSSNIHGAGFSINITPSKLAHIISITIIVLIALINLPLIIQSTLDQLDPDVVWVPGYECWSKKTAFFSNIATGLLASFLPMALIALLSIVLVYLVQKAGKSIAESQIANKALKNNRTTSIMTATISISFLVLTAPIYIAAIATNVSATLGFTFAFLNCMSTTNHAVNFFMYCVSSKFFRMEVFKLLKIKPPGGAVVPATSAALQME